MTNFGVTKYTMFDGAKMYASAADAVNDKMPNSIHVLSHLLCTSIELALKSYLLYVGYSEKRLRAIGHELSKLLKISVQEGLCYTGSRNSVLTVSEKFYKPRLFVYPKNANMNIILPFRLRQMVDELLNEILQIIFTEEEKAAFNKKGLIIESNYPYEIKDSDCWSKIPEQEQ